MCLFNNARHTCGCEVEVSVRPCLNFQHGLQKFYCKNTAANTRIVKDSEEVCYVCKAEQNSTILRKARERWRILNPRAARDLEGEPDAGLRDWASPLRGSYSKIRIVARSKPRKLYEFPSGEYGDRESETEGYGPECFRGTEEVDGKVTDAAEETLIAPAIPPLSTAGVSAAKAERPMRARPPVPEVSVPDTERIPRVRTIPPTDPGSSDPKPRPRPRSRPPSRRSLPPIKAPPEPPKRPRGSNEGWHLITSDEINEEPIMVQRPDHWVDILSPGNSDEDELEEEGVLVRKPNYGPEGSNVSAKLFVRMERERAEAASRR